ncbi:hypothetical protein D1007_42717 [Hordeum vulgare]|nr:hypothetical protein D1007_42717 [Hordeum vulgare]
MIAVSSATTRCKGIASQVVPPILEVAENGSHTEDSYDPDYMAHTDESGEESKVVELRKHARKFKKKIKSSEILFSKGSRGPVPIKLVANVEEAVQDLEFESSDEDYNYDEYEDGQIVRRKSRYVHNISGCKKNRDRIQKTKSYLGKEGEIKGKQSKLKLMVQNLQLRVYQKLQEIKRQQQALNLLKLLQQQALKLAHQFPSQNNNLLFP